MASTFINLPPPPSDPVTPSDMGPGTPNSTTTSLSALSTTAIKDGHTGQPHSHNHHHSSHRHTSSTSSAASTTTLDAERADRISRLAGLERVATVRQSAPANSHQNPDPNNNTTPPGGMAGFVPASGPSTRHPVQAQGYFDHTGAPVVGKECSTVGSASATGSMGGRTTWASGSEGLYEGEGEADAEGEHEGEAEAEAGADKMSDGMMDPDRDGTSSVGGESDGGKESLVGFGEGAGSTVEGPVSGVPARLRESQKAKMIDGVTYDRGVVDTTARSPLPAAALSSGGSATGSLQGTPAPRHAGLSGAETAERIVRERFGNGSADGAGAAGSGDVVMGDAPPDGAPGLGKFDFEK